MKKELEDFCTEWNKKARAIDLSTINGCIDRFFTSYVSYNRLYFQIRLNSGIAPKKGRYFDDRESATKIVVDYLTPQFLESEFQKDVACKNAIDRFIQIIDDKEFNIILSPPHAYPNNIADKKLSNKLKKADAKTNIKAVTEFIYAVRCNTFHGQKSLDENQIKILTPVIIILEKMIDLLMRKM